MVFLEGKNMLSFFDGLTDLRVERTKLHKLKDIIGITICAVLGGCNDWEEIERYGQSKQSWLREFPGLPDGIPSHDTINRVFAALDCKELQGCFSHWIQSIARVTEGRIVSIDGKRLRTSGAFTDRISHKQDWKNLHSLIPHTNRKNYPANGRKADRTKILYLKPVIRSRAF